jgi:hypothetical protein
MNSPARARSLRSWPPAPASAIRSCSCALEDPEAGPKLAAKRIGPPLLFARLWQETGPRAVLEELLESRRFEFAVERAVFVSVLHRIMVSGSDRACESWMADYDIPGAVGLSLHCPSSEHLAQTAARISGASASSGV